ncbi:effector-associated constant component EACC1, partial [Wenzhouxiangella sp. EGI_FJ10305]|uniref:effector-associated constant component EACC1 n=1 Tax=Wenzhouxiangella sp. EGI_FJ10305 TaxID=3243768 RepID=UPI0035D62680
MRIVLFKHSEKSFLQALNQADISYKEETLEPGQIVASGALVTVAQTAAIAGAIASVLVAWIRARASRKIILTLENGQSFHLEGASVDKVEELL